MDQKDDSDPAAIPLAGFLFGNIDESGQLDTDILDNEAKKHLGSLTRFGFGTFLEEIIGGEGVLPRDEDQGRSSQSGSDSDEVESEVQTKPETESGTLSSSQTFLLSAQHFYNSYFSPVHINLVPRRSIVVHYIWFTSFYIGTQIN